ncbi:MAG TPA: ribose 5-phosphate isomerase B [Bryobacteraceae bacterium]|nr:ribose 5-phosphate isomerase B [Bryobacteraceae bacterium]
MAAVITEIDVPQTGELKIAAGTIVTPSARDLAVSRGVTIIELAKDKVVRETSAEETVALGADHGGYRLKEALKPLFHELKLEVLDLGVHEEKSVDYPDIAEEVGAAILTRKAFRGVIIDGAGIGSAMAANKMPGIRAALCYDKPSARNSREHNDSNVLTLGGRLLTQTQAEDVVRIWLTTPFAAGRHSQRIEKIASIEQRYANWKPRN